MKTSTSLRWPLLLVLWATSPAWAQMAPGEDPVILSQPVDYLRLPLAKTAPSTGLETIKDIPSSVKAKIVRYEAKALVGAEGVLTDSDVITTRTGTAGMGRTCIQEIASNTQTGGQFNRYGPSTGQDQMVVLRGDLVNVCR